jgi:hypothetical protein
MGKRMTSRIIATQPISTQNQIMCHTNGFTANSTALIFVTTNAKQLETKHIN